MIAGPRAAVVVVVADTAVAEVWERGALEALVPRPRSWHAPARSASAATTTIARLELTAG
jgi:hypothetical protein